MYCTSWKLHLKMSNLESDTQSFPDFLFTLLLGFTDKFFLSTHKQFWAVNWNYFFYVFFFFLTLCWTIYIFASNSATVHLISPSCPLGLGVLERQPSLGCTDKHRSNRNHAAHGRYLHNCTRVLNRVLNCSCHSRSSDFYIYCILFEEI